MSCTTQFCKNFLCITSKKKKITGDIMSIEIVTMS